MSPEGRKPRIVEIRGLDALLTISRSWRELCDHADKATPFQHPEWLIPWWRVFGNDSLCGIAVYASQRLMAFAPLFIYHQKSGLRVLTFVGAGVSDYLDVVAEPGFEILGSSLIVEQLCNLSAEWDICDFADLRPSSPLLKANLPTGFESEIGITEFCPVITIPDSQGFGAYWSTLSEEHRKSVTSGMKRLEKKGRLRLQNAATANVPEYMAHLFRLHQAAWKVRGLEGVLASHMVREFHQQAAQSLAAAGMLHLNLLTVDEHPIAAFYGMVKAKALYCYIGGFDPDLKRCSPGSVLNYHVIANAVEKGTRTIDFLRGQETYKYLWGARDQTNYRIRMWDKRTGKPDMPS